MHENTCCRKVNRYLHSASLAVSIMLVLQMRLWILIGLNIITKVHGFSNGNFPQSCDSLSPEHLQPDGSPFLAKTTAPPFMVEHEQNSGSGDPITVVLSGTSTRFRGFMLEARDAGSGSRVGKFLLLDSDNTRLLTCSGLADSAVSQRNNREKDLVRVNWTAPEIDQDVIFRATFVQSFTDFWENVTSTFRLPTTTAVPTTPVPTTAVPTTPVPTTAVPTTAVPTTPVPTTPVPTTAVPTTPVPTTAVPTTAVPSTTTTTPEPSSTSSVVTSPTMSSATPNSNSSDNTAFRRRRDVGHALMCVECVLEEVKMEMSNIFTVLVARGTLHRRLSEVSKVVISMLCLGVEVASLSLFCAGGSCHAVPVGLVSVVMVINFLEQVIWSVTVRHQLNPIGGIAVKVCFVIHQSFTTAVLYVGVSACCGRTWSESYALKGLMALTAWIFLTVVWTLVFSAQKKAIRGATEQEPLNSRGRCSQQQRTRNPSAARGILIAVSLLFILGTTSLAVAVFIGIVGCQKN